MRRMAVPTDDKRVKDRLRAYGEPITLFGEGVSGLLLGLLLVALELVGRVYKLTYSREIDVID